MLIRVTTAEECDARDDDSSNEVGIKKIGVTILNTLSVRRLASIENEVCSIAAGIKKHAKILGSPPGTILK